MSGIVPIDFDMILSLARTRKANIITHSGRTSRGDIFVSLPKAAPNGPDGADYSGVEIHLEQAVRAGAAYVVCTGKVLRATETAFAQPVDIRAAIVADPRASLGQLAAAWHGTENSGVSILGITGTNGKTTSSYLLEAVLRVAGHVPGVIGTVEYRWPGHEEPSTLTTPDCMALQGMVAAMEKAGADTAVMEISSHAIDQNRIAGLSFAGALFTNLTQDHLDYHRNMEEYFSVKARLFTPVSKGGLALPGAALAANIDDAYGQRIFAANKDVLGFSLERKGERILNGTIMELGPVGLRLRMAYEGHTWELASPLVGEFNAFNLLGAQALALAFGLDENSLQALAVFGGVPGRLERVNNPYCLSVFVDYAHTPDALQKTLVALRGAGFERIVTVFGCGGNRDRAKRPLMGEAASAFSDVVVLTSDNPRKEDPDMIMTDVRLGLAKARKVLEEKDRRKAIGMALDIIKPGDALLIAGKGHEPYQIIGETKYTFSDQKVVREHLGCA